jgi:transketolase
MIVVEDHYEAGAAYEAICGAVPTAIKKAAHLCVRKIPGSAKPSEQLVIHGIDSESIAKKVKELLQ